MSAAGVVNVVMLTAFSSKVFSVKVIAVVICLYLNSFPQMYLRGPKY